MIKYGKTWIITGLLLIAAALILVGYNLYSDSEGGVRSAEIVSALAEQVPEQAEQPEQEPCQERYPDYILNPGMEMPTVEIDGRKYIGTVTVSDLGLVLPVAAEWDYPSLKNSPCRYQGSAYLDDLIICGHNYDSHFGRLKHLSAGAEVLFADAAGNVFRYRVTGIEILEPTAIEEMEQGGDLTLFTCTIGGKSRVTVRCERIRTGQTVRASLR